MKRKTKNFNSIYLEQDPYMVNTTDTFGLFPMEEVVSKSYHFERYDDDIINSPKKHRIKKCELNITITDENDIKGLIKFLDILKLNLIKEEKDDA